MSREIAVAESPLPQRVGELIAYSLDTTPYGGSPTAISITLERRVGGGTLWESVTLSGSHSVVGSVITTPRVSVDAGRKYRLNFQFTASGQDWRPYLIIDGKD